MLVDVITMFQNTKGVNESSLLGKGDNIRDGYHFSELLSRSSAARDKEQSEAKVKALRIVLVGPPVRA